MSLKHKIRAIGLPPILLLLTIVSIVSVAITIYYEYRARQNDYIRLLEQQAGLFINTVRSATQNALTAADDIEMSLNNKILSSIKLIGKMDEYNELSAPRLDEIARTAGVTGLQLYDSQGRLESASTEYTMMEIPTSILNTFLSSSSSDSIVTVFDTNNPLNTQVYALVRRDQGGLVAALAPQDDIQTLRQSLGIGYFLQRFQAEENVEYAIIQTSRTIVAGSFSGYDQSFFAQDEFLRQVQENENTDSRILNYKDILIFETVSPFYIYDIPYGVLRLGLSMREYQRLQKDIRGRLFIFGAVFILFGLVFVNFLITYRHRRLLHRDLGHLREYTNTVLDNLSSGVISFDQNGIIRSVNKQAQDFLNAGYESMYNESYKTLPQEFAQVIENSMQSKNRTSTTTKKWVSIKDNEKRLYSLHTNMWQNESGKNYVLIINDITDQSLLEEQRQRNQRLSAMRNLAFSVAHEIKNPLNAIKLLIELVRKKHKPAQDQENYLARLDTVNSEITRISDIVEQYLRLSRPPSLTLDSVNFPALWADIHSLFAAQLDEKNISFDMQIHEHPEYRGDPDQLKQMFINLIKNAQEAVEHDGRILVKAEVLDHDYVTRIADDGKGIAEKDLDTIFDLHFTTKTKGSGIGLSVVQQIVETHAGTIDVESEPGAGTTFIIRLPFERLGEK